MQYYTVDIVQYLIKDILLYDIHCIVLYKYNEVFYHPLLYNTYTVRAEWVAILYSLQLSEKSDQKNE